VNKTHRLALGIAFVGIWLVIASSLSAVWLTGEVRVIGFVMPVAVIAGLLIVFFEWRAERRSNFQTVERDAAVRPGDLGRAA
jgi:hypothetical protein